MLFLQLTLDGLVHGCAIGLVAVTFAHIYVTTGIFHVAHAGIFTLSGYLAWYCVGQGMSMPAATASAVLGCAAVGALMQKCVYEPLMKRHSTPLVLLIASIGLVAVLQNTVAIFFTPNVLQFDALAWRTSMLHLGGIDVTYP
jgi:branched-subunit amino acid ABC-type transport system permease component